MITELKYRNGFGLFTLRIVLMIASLIMTNILHAQNNVNIGGYGELHYNKMTNGADLQSSAGTLDFHRFILYLGYQFTDWVRFNSELELEHTLIEGDEETGEVALEQAFIELQYKPELGFRAGILLVPLGIVNPVHEPPTFHGVERPNTEKYIIPSTWREAGMGFIGRFRSGLRYEAYLMAGLNPDGISGSSGIRGARQNGFESTTQDFALTARLDYTVNLNLKIGAGVFFSTLERSTQYGDTLTGAQFGMGEVHVHFNRGNFQARGLLVYSHISNADRLNRFYTTTENTSTIGDGQVGAYAEAAWDFLGYFLPETEQRLFAFTRYEYYNTHQQTTGFRANPNFERRETTIGLSYLPHPSVALKADYQFLNAAGEKDVQQFNLGMGYNF